MNTIANTERPKLKLNFAKPPMSLTSLAPLASKRVVVIDKSKTSDKTDKKDVNLDGGKALDEKSIKDGAKAKNKGIGQSTKQTKPVSNKVVVNLEEIIKAKIKRNKKDYQLILAKLQADYPDCFPKDPKLLAIGIHLELRKVLHGQFASNQLYRFLHRYCGSFKYKEKLVEGAQRFNLDGSHATLVTKKEIPPIINKPKFVKKPKDAKDLDKNDSALS